MALWTIQIERLPDRYGLWSGVAHEVEGKYTLRSEKPTPASVLADLGDRITGVEIGYERKRKGKP